MRVPDGVGFNRIADSVIVLLCTGWLLLFHSPASTVVLIAALSYLAIRANRREPILRIAEYVVTYNIAQSGDALITEEFRGVRSEFLPVREVQDAFESRSGYFDTPAYPDCRPDSQHVRWRWLDAGGPKRRGQTEFEPRLHSSPIDFVRRLRAYNLVAFNQRDRRDNGASPEEAQTERIRHFIGARITLFVLRVTFPDKLPEKLVAEARTAKQAKVDAKETVRILGKQVAERTYELTIEKPRIGYRYQLTWSLPVDEIEQLNLGLQAIGLANDATQYLINAQAGMRQAELRHELDEFAVQLRQQFATPELNLSLYVYRSLNTVGSLVCAAGTNATNSNPGRIQVGRTPVGRCYRRNKIILFNSLVPKSDDDLAYEPVPGEEKLQPPTIACCIPLPCPTPSGRKIGVLYLTTRSNTGGLAGLFSDPQLAADIGKQVLAWYSVRVPAALGMKDTLFLREKGRAE
ncbi:hypothetical protein [Nevskia soli]|jgi:hypothetical protein|uniref:hypothetical protein n=1 Tax=Nevskia soli TaxID=418856 RepID=UPI0015D8FADB|nr:hypothetical protein [Nevskia soli]